MSLHSVSLSLHVAAGALALAGFWLALALRKGSPAHRRAGRAFLAAMLVVIATGLPLTALLAQRGQWISAAFLAYLLVLVTNSCVTTWRSVRLRRDFAAYTGAPMRWMSGITGLAGLAVIALGLARGAWLLPVFGVVGLLAAIDAWRLARRGPADPNWWLHEHVGAMLGNGVAAHIAFFAIGLRRLLPGLDPALMAWVPWVLPLAVALVAGIWLGRRIRRGELPGARRVRQM